VACEVTEGCEFFSYIPDESVGFLCLLCAAPENQDYEQCLDEGAPNGQCVGGPETCPGEPPEPLPAELLTSATTAAAEFCARGPDDFDWSTPNANNEPPLPFAGSDEEDLLGWALALFAITREWQDGVHDDDVAFQAALGPAADTSAAAILDNCGEAPCGYGAALVSNVRSFLLLYDANASRAFADDAKRRALFDEHSIFLADDGYFDEASVDAISNIYATLPTRLMEQGVLGAGTQFCTATCQEAFRCDDDTSQGRILVVTKTSFNVHRRRLGEMPENVFRKTTTGPTWPGTPMADNMMSVFRHETAHQFDRTMNPRQQELRTSIAGRCIVDENWLRAGLLVKEGSNAYFKAHHQEIVAGNIGNQYIYSTSTQLEVARYRADAVGDLLPMAWFAFEVDVVGDETSTTFFERVSRGYVQTIPVGIDRTYPGGPVKTLRVPGCGTFDFEYDVSTGHLSGYTYAPGFGETDPSAPCLPKMDGTAFPTVVPTTYHPSPRPSLAPTSYLMRGFPPCGVVVMKGEDPTDAFCETNPRHGYAFACCRKTEKNECSRHDGDSKNGCWAGKKPFVPQTWFEARETCHRQGLKLCDETDKNVLRHMESPNCRGGGCGYDDKYVWSGVPCVGADPVYDVSATCAPTASLAPTAAPTSLPSPHPSAAPSVKPTLSLMPTPAPLAPTNKPTVGPCVCADIWGAPLWGGDCAEVQIGCTEDCSNGGYDPWCMVDNPGCDEEGASGGGGWAYCDL